MKINLKEDGNEVKNRMSTSSWQATFDDSSLIVDIDNDRTLIFEGSLFYCRSVSGNILACDPGFEAEIKKLALQDINVSSFVEGSYVAALLDHSDDSITVMNDAFGSVDMFYDEGEQNLIASTQLSDILSPDNMEYQQEVLYCISILGYSPAKYTPYKNIQRIAYNEDVLFKDDKKTVNTHPVKEIEIRSMQENDIDKYGELFTNSVLSRASGVENWVLASGGWDSNIVLSTLCKHIDKSKIKLIVSKILLPDGRCFNPHEVAKVEKIAEYHGLEYHVVEACMGSEETHDYIKGMSSNSRAHLLFEWMPLYYPISDFIVKNGKKGASVFQGSYSDALHNFGFSQYFSLLYLSADFRAYGDKMQSYLYSPSFLRKVENDSYKDDFVYKMFCWEHSINDTDSNKNVFDYLLSFIISDHRIPFENTATDVVFENGGVEIFKQWLYENYFKEVVDNINPGNMYHYLIHLYKHFHLQGTERRVITSRLKGTGFNHRTPFLDSQLVEFLSAMPEDWGRGLEWREVKYPLKEFASKHLDIPVDIIKSDFHSYIIEKENEDHSIDWRSEVINNSSLGSEWRDANKQTVINDVFDKKYFNIDELKKRFSNQASPQISKTHLNLISFLTVEEDNGGNI